MISPIVRILYGFVVEPPAERGEFTVAIVVISVVSGFLAHLVGGWVAGRLAGRSGGLNGAMTAVFGLALGLFLTAMLSSLGLVFSEGVAIPPVGFGITGWAVLAGLILFLVNLFGGFVGGKLGEPSRPEAKRTP
jgi:membrane associated rhomboid family serine protease